MARKNYAKYQHLVSDDAIYELRRARARAGNIPDSMEDLRLLEEDGSMDKAYKTMLLSLLSIDGRDDPRKKKTETFDVIEQRRKANALKKRKHNYGITRLDDDCDVEEETDPEYGLILSKIKENDKSSLLKFEKGHLSLSQAVKCYVDRGYEEVGIVQIDKQQFYQEARRKDHCVVEGLPKSVHRAQTGEKSKTQDGRKLKKVARQGDHEISDRGLVQFGKEHFDPRGKRKIYQDSGSSKRVVQVQQGRKHVPRGQTELMEGVRALQGDNGSSSKKTVVGKCVVKEPDHSVKIHRPIKGIHSQIRDAKCAKCSAPLKKSDGKYLKGESTSKTVPAEVEILDSDMVIKERIFSPFIPSKELHSSMMDEEPKNHGLPSASNEFRKEVLKVLRRPFDKDEYRKGREEIRDKFYTSYYPGLQKKLTKFRWKQGKCLIILRGFFFWLQNLTREGSFQPWMDKECLAVELPSR